MLDPASLNLTEPDSEQEALRCVFLEFAAAFPWFSHVARRCAYLDLESRVAREVKVHEVSTVRAVSLTHGSHLETGGIYFVGEGPGSGDFSASRVYLGYVVIMAMIPDNVYSAPRIGRTGQSEHLKAFGADRSSNKKGYSNSTRLITRPSAPAASPTAPTRPKNPVNQ